MAQRTIHLLIAQLIENEYIYDKNRFRIGSILPDAYKEKKNRNISHFRKNIELEHQILKYSDFVEFKNRYAEKIKNDDLYLGYYMHLFEDCLYRRFVKEKGIYDKMLDPKTLEILYKDYNVLNEYICKQYQLEGNLTWIDTNELNDICQFDLDKQLKDLSDDLNCHYDYKTTYLTEDMLDEFIEKNIELCRSALENIQQEKETLNPIDFCW